MDLLANYTINLAGEVMHGPGFGDPSSVAINPSKGG